MNMNTEFDDFSDVINNVQVERKKTRFQLNQLKLEHHYFNSGDIDVGMPISTSIEVTSDYNFEKGALEWKKTISHTYLSFNNYHEDVTDSYTEELNDANNLIRQIEAYDLRDLKNNYFTDENPEQFTHWELTYNYYFKIVGTYDQKIEEFSEMSRLLGFRKVIEDEVKKVQDKIEQFDS